MNKDTTISVTGAGTAGCFTALYLAKNYPDNQIVWVVESLTNNIGVGEATVPIVQDFLTDLGYNAEYILSKCNGSLKLGIHFKNFSDHDFWHPFGNNKQEQNDILYMSRKNKIPDNIFDYDDIATHFDVSVLIRDFYQKLSSMNNVTIVDTYQECDVNVLCTGFDKISTDNFVPADKLLNTQAYVHRSEYVDIQDKVPYSVCIGAERGWIWQLSLGDTVTHGYVNDGKEGCRDEFLDFLSEQNIKLDPDSIRKIQFNCGRKKVHLTRDKHVQCHIGLSSRFLEPLESTGMYFIVHSILTLGKYLNGEIDESQYNDMINSDYDTVYNFIIAHYTGSSNPNDYWTECKTKTYERTTNNLFPNSSWDYVLNGLQRGTGESIPVKNFRSLSTGIPYAEWSKQFAHDCRKKIS